MRFSPALTQNLQTQAAPTQQLSVKELYDQNLKAACPGPRKPTQVERMMALLLAIIQSQRQKSQSQSGQEQSTSPTNALAQDGRPAQAVLQDMMNQATPIAGLAHIKVPAIPSPTPLTRQDQARIYDQWNIKLVEAMEKMENPKNPDTKYSDQLKNDFNHNHPNASKMADFDKLMLSQMPVYVQPATHIGTQGGQSLSGNSQRPVAPIAPLKMAETAHLKMSID